MKRVLAVFVFAAMFISVLCVPFLSAGALAQSKAPVSKYAELTGISATSGTLTRAFSKSRLSYTLNLDEATAETTVTPQKADPAATMLINGEAAESITVKLDNGKQKKITVSVALQGKKPRTYTVKVVRAKSSNNDLASLAVSAGTLDPVFDPAQQKYKLNLDWYSPIVLFGAAKLDSHATLRINNRCASKLNIKTSPGVTQMVKITVRSQTKVTKTYLVSVTREASPYSSIIDALVNFAKHYIGKPYIRGAKGPNSFDCSGFVYYCLNGAGVNINYMTSATWAKSKYTTIARIEEMVPGDILCFKGHVGIYLGDSTMIDCVPSAGGVRIASCTTNYWKKAFICGKRVIAAK
jgi:cell wall-associated NlpC family hydrolase